VFISQIWRLNLSRFIHHLERPTGCIQGSIISKYRGRIAACSGNMAMSMNPHCQVSHPAKPSRPRRYLVTRGPFVDYQVLIAIVGNQSRA